MFGATEFDPAKEKAGPSIAEQVEGMAALIEAGKIRHYGLSNETAWGVCEFRRAAREQGVPGPVTLQNSYSLVSRGVDNDLAETLHRESMSLLAYSPLAGGMLSGKYLGRRAAAEVSLHAVRLARPALQEADGRRSDCRLRRARQAARTHAPQLALAYVKSRWYLGTSIIGATTMAQLEEDIAAAQLELDAPTLADIQAIQLRYPNPAG
jgi:aryl-alcohol dehydrogenase-like predicted oxidoreductase